MYLLFIALHTLAALAAFGLGCAVLRPPVDVRGWRFRLYLAGLVGLLVFLAGAVASHWGDLAPATRAVFLALGGLGVVMVGRAVLAARLPRQGAAWVGHVGFTLVALFDGFAIVAALDLGAPVWLAVAIAVAAVLVGRAAVGRVEASVGATVGAGGTAPRRHPRAAPGD